MLGFYCIFPFYYFGDIIKMNREIFTLKRIKQYINEIINLQYLVFDTFNILPLSSNIFYTPLTKIKESIKPIFLKLALYKKT